jgi:uncharacterized YccA/Bax inhibitor family protein
MNSSNPMLKEAIFMADNQAEGISNKMTLSGIADKTLILTAILLAAGGWTWRVFSVQGVQNLAYYLTAGIIFCLGLSIWAFNRPESANITGPINAVFEGFVLGSITAIFEVEFSGIVIHAAASTVGVLIILILVYKLRFVRVTLSFWTIIILSVLGLLLANFSTWLLSQLGVKVTYLYETGFAGILIAFLIITFAAMNLILDLNFIEDSIARGARKNLEWFGAFALIVSLAWLYPAIVRFLIRLKPR